MDFEDFKEQAANYLEDARIDSDIVSDEILHGLWLKRVKPHQVADLLRTAVLYADSAIFKASGKLDTAITRLRAVITDEQIERLICNPALKTIAQLNGK